MIALEIRQLVQSSFFRVRERMTRSSPLYGISLVFFALGTWQIARYYTSHTRQESKQKRNIELQKLLSQNEVSFVSDGLVLVGPKISPLSKEFGYYLIKHFQLTPDRDCIVNIGWISKDTALNPLKLIDLNKTVTSWLHRKDATRLNLVYDDLNEQRTLLMPYNPTTFSLSDTIPISIFHHKNIQDLTNIYKTEQSPLCFKNILSSDQVLCMNTNKSYNIPHIQYASTWYSLSLITTIMLYLRK